MYTCTHIHMRLSSFELWRVRLLVGGRPGKQPAPPDARTSLRPGACVGVGVGVSVSVSITIIIIVTNVITIIQYSYYTIM